MCRDGAGRLLVRAACRGARGRESRLAASAFGVLLITRHCTHGKATGQRTDGSQVIARYRLLNCRHVLLHTSPSTMIGPGGLNTTFQNPLKTSAEARSSGRASSFSERCLMDADRRWWERGERPDYRFSLANERTFLAWIRTSLALVAGGLAAHQFGTSLDPTFRLALSLLLLLTGGVVGGSAYSRWRAAETAMRLQADLPRGRALPLLALLVALIAASLGIALILSAI